MRLKNKNRKFTLYCNHKIANVDFDFCCHPKRGDAVLAFVKGGNAIVHHKLCDRADKMIDNNQDMVFIKWDSNIPKSYKLIFLWKIKRCFSGIFGIFS